LASKNSTTLAVLWAERLSTDAVQVEPDRCLGHQVAEEVNEVVTAGRVGDPAGDGALVDAQPGREHGGAVAAVLELLAGREARDGRPRGVDAALGLDAGLFVDRPHHRVLGRVEGQPAHVPRLLPEVGVVAGRP
jgi:hypothetical protein